MISLPVLQVIWWALIGLVLILYATTAGFDFGATLIVPFIRDQTEKRVILNVVGKTWDGNQTWLVFAGGALLVIWPGVYAAIFSGLYAAMLCILWAFFLRPPGFDYREKITHPLWRRAWEWGLLISAILPVFIFGLIAGNLLQGLPIFFDTFDLRSYYQGNFFQLLNPFGVVSGIIALLLSLMHGAALLQRRTEATLKYKMQQIFRISAILFLITFTVEGIMLAYSIKGFVLVSSPINPLDHPLDNIVTTAKGLWLKQYIHYPWKIIGPIIAYLSTVLALLTLHKGRGGIAFGWSVLAVTGVMLTAGLTLFPFIVPSTINLAQSMTVWNATSDQYTLNIMLYVASALLLIILLYKLFAYWAVWRGKSTLTAAEIKQNEHGFY